MSILLDLTRSGISEKKIASYQKKVSKIHNQLHRPDDKKRPFLGWLSAPEDQIGQAERINDLADRIKSQSQVLFVIGIGGSYLGSRSVIEALKPNFYNRFAEKEGELEIYFAGNNLSTDYLHDLLRIGREKDFSLIVISKSGTTLEPALSFRLFRELATEKYGDSASGRIFVITDEKNGILLKIAAKQKYESLSAPSDIGGRYSVLTPVGLLPIATAGIDIFRLLEGAKDMQKKLKQDDLEANEAYRYAVARNILYKKSKKIEVLANYNPKLHYFSEWWKQLFGESEGKSGKGIFPASVNFTTDLHSLGQLIQEGQRNIFETVINIKTPLHSIEFSPQGNEDGLSYLEGKSLDFINKQALNGTVTAHAAGSVPNIIFSMSNLSDYNMGQLIFLFEKACAMSGYIFGVNPFDQPGVELYKKNMFQLLGRTKN